MLMYSGEFIRNYLYQVHVAAGYARLKMNLKNIKTFVYQSMMYTIYYG